MAYITLVPTHSETSWVIACAWSWGGERKRWRHTSFSRLRSHKTCVQLFLHFSSGSSTMISYACLVHPMSQGGCLVKMSGSSSWREVCDWFTESLSGATAAAIGLDTTIKVNFWSLAHTTKNTHTQLYLLREYLYRYYIGGRPLCCQVRCPPVSPRFARVVNSWLEILSRDWLPMCIVDKITA